MMKSSKLVSLGYQLVIIYCAERYAEAIQHIASFAGAQVPVLLSFMDLQALTSRRRTLRVLNRNLER